MLYRRVGTTELQVSEIGFGTGGNAGLMVRGSFEDQARVVGSALDGGITYFDTAPDYGAGVAEVNLGNVLKALGARPVMTTKIEIRAENLGDIAGHVVRSLEDSLRALQRDVVDVVQIHNGPSTMPPVLEGRSYRTLALDDYLKPNGVMEGLDRVLRQGKARYAGFICRGNDVDAIRALLRTGVFHLLNVPYSLLNPTAGQAEPVGPATERDHGNVIALARNHGLGTAIFSPLAGGILTDQVLNDAPTHPYARQEQVRSLNADAIRKAKKFRALAARAGIGITGLAYRFILQHPGVSTVLGGFSSVEQLRDVVSIDSSSALSEALTQEIEEIWRS